MREDYNYTVVGRDAYGMKVLECHFDLISHALNCVKKFPVWQVEMVDNRSGEILFHKTCEKGIIWNIFEF